MPNRVIRQGFLDSEKINALSEECQNFFIRLTLVVDDYGRFDARPELLKSQCYPVTDKCQTDVSRMLTSLKNIKLINLYSVNNKQYLEIINFNQRLRQKKERFPAYCGQLSDNSQTDVSQLQARMPESESETESETESEVEKKGNTPNLPKKFIPPTIEEVKKYIEENNYFDVDANRWWNFYNAKNWMIGKNKMKNWHSAIATWHKKDTPVQYGISPEVSEEFLNG